MVTTRHRTVEKASMDLFTASFSNLWLKEFGTGDVTFEWTREMQAMWMADENLRTALGALLHTGIFPTWPMSTLRARGMQLNNADYRGMRLMGADFSECDLVDAMFLGSDLSGASFRGADLRGACFDGAKLVNADFTGALVSMVTGLGRVWEEDENGVASRVQ